MESSDTTPSPSKSLSPLLIAGLIVTILAVLGGIALVVLDMAMWSVARSSGTQAIEQAAEPRLTLPIIIGINAVLVGVWTLWFVRGRGLRSIATIACGALSLVLLIAAGSLGWQAMTQSRSLTVAPMSCEASDLKVRGGNPIDGCDDVIVDTGALLEGEQSDDTWRPTDSDQISTFEGLPAGGWLARLTVNGQDDTVTVHIVAARDGRWTRIGQLRPSLDIESGDLRWSGTISTNDTDSDVKVLYYASGNPAVASAAIRFNVRDCAGQSIRTFDATACQPMQTGSVFVQEQTPDETRTWRQPHVSMEGTTLVVTNLEARTYDLAPNYVTVQSSTGSTDILIIPTAMEQIEANSVTVPGDSSFPVEITPTTGIIEYTIYVFPSGEQFAFAP